MEFKVELKEEDLQSDLESRLIIRVEEIVAETIRSWSVRKMIEDRSDVMLKTKLDLIITNSINNNKKTLEDRVNTTLDALIKSKVKRAMKQ